MRKKAAFIWILLVFLELTICAPALAQETANQSPGANQAKSSPRLSATKLEDLCKPIALYPDALLSQMLPAAAFPEQIVDAALLIKNKEDAKRVPEQSWDKSVQAIAYYPGVLKMMYEKLDWTTKLGNAFLSQHKELLSAIQRLRARAKQYGNLKSNSQQKVYSDSTSTGETIIKIEPTNPEVLYVPEATTTVIYTQPAPPAAAPLAPLATFGMGVAVGAAIEGDTYHSAPAPYPYPYAGHYWGPGGIWVVNDNAYDDWYDQRQKNIEHAQDQSKERQDYRQDYKSNRQDFHQDRANDRQDFRQQMIEENPEQAQQYYSQRKQNIEDRRNPQQNATQPSAADRQAQYSAREQQVNAARQDMNRQWPQSSEARSNWASSRGYSEGTARGSAGDAFSGISSGERASTFANRGAASRGGAGQFRGRSGGGGMGRRR